MSGFKSDNCSTLKQSQGSKNIYSTTICFASFLHFLLYYYLIASLTQGPPLKYWYDQLGKGGAQPPLLQGGLPLPPRLAA